MNRRLIYKIVGLIMMIEAVFMILPLLVALITNEPDWIWFLVTLAPTAFLGYLLFRIKTKHKNLYARDGFVIVGAAWVVMSLIGAVPFFISGFIPDFINALFESVSGFTTSGISIVPDIESASHAMLFWRSLTHWIGGMGVLVFMLAISPVVGGSSIILMRAESPGPTTEKISPKISTTAKWLYAMYIGLTVCEIIALACSGLTVFQSTLIAFGTLATGGFSFLNSSLAAFTMGQQIIVEIFMLLAGVNFSLYFLILTGKTIRALKDIELRWYLIILGSGILFITLNVFFAWGQFETLGETIHHSIFASLSAMTSTGFSAYDYNLWPTFSKTIMLMLMFVGGCAGSTAGGIKVSRFVLLFKGLKRTIKETVSPKGVNSIRFNGKSVSDGVIRSVVFYFGLVAMILVFSMVIVSLEPTMDMQTALTSVATTLNNNGIELKGPSVGGFWTFAWWTRLVYIINMLIGRLEIYPVMALVIHLFGPLGRIYDKSARTARKMIK